MPDMNQPVTQDDTSERILSKQEVASNTPIIERERSSCDGMTHPEILAAMMAEAECSGYEPCDLNHAGLPNIYLRERFARNELPDGSFGPPYHIEDLFVMNVRPKVR